jgi:rhodanese-related sulfurtransferase
MYYGVELMRTRCTHSLNLFILLCLLLTWAGCAPHVYELSDESRDEMKQPTTADKNPPETIKELIVHTTDTLDEVRAALLADKALLIDVREQDEWAEGHLRSAQFLPLSSLTRAAEEGVLDENMAEKLPKDKIIYLHCRSGGRVKVATTLLRPLGYDIRPLQAGFTTLVQEGFEQAD